MVQVVVNDFGIFFFDSGEFLAGPAARALAPTASRAPNIYCTRMFSQVYVYTYIDAIYTYIEREREGGRDGEREGGREGRRNGGRERRSEGGKGGRERQKYWQKQKESGMLEIGIGAMASEFSLGKEGGSGSLIYFSFS